MTDESNWLQRLTRRVTDDVFGNATSPATTDANLLADMHKQAAYDRQDYEQRVRKNNEILGALAPFQDRLDALHTLAETTPDPLRSGSYGWLHRTMDEELGLIAGDLQRGELTFDDIPAKFDEWRGLGTSYARTISGEEAAAAIFTGRAGAALPTDPATLADIGQRYSDAATADLNVAVSQLQAELETETDIGRDDEVWAWIERGGVDLGHAELSIRIEARANAADRASDPDTAHALRRLAEKLDNSMQDEGFAAIQSAVGLPADERPTYLDRRQQELRERTQLQVACLVDDLDLTTPEPVAAFARQVAEEAAQWEHQHEVELDVLVAYENKLQLMADDDASDHDEETRWLYLTELRAALDQQARQAGQEPHSREDVDAALRRLTHDTRYTAHVIPEDHAHLLTDADHHAAVTFGAAERHMIRIDYPEPAAVATEPWFAEDHDSADTHQVVEAKQPVDETGLGSAEDEDADEDSDDLADEDTAEHQIADTAPATDDLAEASKTHEDQAEQANQPVANDDDASVTADSSASDPCEDKETLACDDERVAADPVAVSETTACAIAVTRAQCAIDRAHQQLDTAEQEAAAERDDELTRWHADDTAAQTENQQTQNHDAAGEPGRGE